MKWIIAGLLFALAIGLAVSTAAIRAETWTEADPILMATTWHRVPLTDPGAAAAATEWWEGLVAAGGEGMVVKPLDFVARGRKGLLQPAVKCRGPEYLRIIYGPAYREPANLERLRGIPVSTVHGRCDQVCRPAAAWRLHEALGALGIDSQLWFVDGNGHSDTEPGVGGALRAEADRIASR